MLKAPFPWFGGKSRVAAAVWERFGNPLNYVEPFFGSGAVLLSRPSPPHTETVNDKDGMLSNFWRALQAAPEDLARHADWPVNECDLHARHQWLVNRKAAFQERLEADPAFFDVQAAGWWVWGISLWIGSGWCDGTKARQLPHLGDAGMGVHRKLPHLGNAGMGVHRQLPHLGDAGRAEALLEYFGALSARLRGVRVCCGDWSRVMGPSPTVKHGLTAVFLDPPYAAEADRQEDLYAEDDLQVAKAARKWALEHGDDPLLRIALCGYEGEYEMPATWECWSWKARGGYGSQSASGNGNSKRERIWFSPHCLKTDILTLCTDKVLSSGNFMV